MSKALTKSQIAGAIAEKAEISKKQATAILEIIAKYCGKGSGILVEGRLKLDQWEDKKTGEKRSRLGVVLENFTFIGGKSQGGEEGGSAPRSRGGNDTPAPSGDHGGDDVPF